LHWICQNLTEALGKSWDFRFTIAKQTPPLKKKIGGLPFTVVDATLTPSHPLPSGNQTWLAGKSPVYFDDFPIYFDVHGQFFQRPGIFDQSFSKSF
jgi:hypothetical protein